MIDVALRNGSQCRRNIGFRHATFLLQEGDYTQKVLNE